MCKFARKNDLIVVHNEPMKRFIMSAYPNVLAKVVTANEIKSYYRATWYRPVEDLTYDYVWIDEPRVISEPVVNMIFSDINAEQFILLGE
jgi:hypothetical protein